MEPYQNYKWKRRKLYKREAEEKVEKYAKKDKMWRRRRSRRRRSGRRRRRRRGGRRRSRRRRRGSICDVTLYLRGHCTALCTNTPSHNVTLWSFDKNQTWRKNSDGGSGVSRRAKLTRSCAGVSTGGCVRIRFTLGTDLRSCLIDSRFKISGGSFKTWIWHEFAFGPWKHFLIWEKVCFTGCFFHWASP